MKRRNVVIGAAVTAGVVTTIGELIYSRRESKQQHGLVQTDQNELAKANEEKLVANEEAVKKARVEIMNAVKKARVEVMSAVKKARVEVRNAGKELAAAQEDKPKKKGWLMKWLNSESKIISNMEFPQKESQKQIQPEETEAIHS